MPTISIHAFRVEGDFSTVTTKLTIGRFQSTPSVWKATFLSNTPQSHIYISIHAFRVEGDCKS